MNMTKTRKVMAGMGAVALVAVCVAGYMVVSALMDKSEVDESLEMSESSYSRLAKAKIAPTAASVSSISSNMVVLSDWYDATRREIAVGDVPVSSNVNEAAFKQKMVDDARALSKLPGAVVPEAGGPGTLVKEGFPFGFGRYISGGELPAKEALLSLQREWSDIMLFAKVFSSCGVDELAKLEVLSSSQAQRPEEAAVAPRPAQRGRKAAPEEEKLCDEERYSVEIVVRPAALVKVLNALAACPRFVSVESLEFFRQTDMIADALSGSGDKGEKASSSSSGKRERGRKKKKQQEEESAAFGEEGEAAAKKSGFVTDPKKEAPFTVRMVIATCDFGTGGEAAAKPDEAPEGETANEGDAAKEGEAAKDGNAAKEGDAVKEEVKQ